MADRLFRDRREAGRVLARLLDRYRGRPDVIVLGLPRGRVPVAYEVAIALGAPSTSTWSASSASPATRRWPWG
jgi:predicted phosphoribosyltransferase